MRKLMALAGALFIVGAAQPDLALAQQGKAKQESKQHAYEEFTALTFLPDRFHETDEHFLHLARALAGVDLHAAPAVREAAQRAYNLELKRDEHEEESEEYKRLAAELESAQGEFRDAARKELRFHPE